MAPKATTEEDWREDVRTFRLQTNLRRRWLSFISVFAVICVAILLLLFSVRWKATPCQFHTKNVELIMFTKPTATMDSLQASAAEVLKVRGYRMSPPTNKSILGTLSVEQHSFLDTNTRQLRESSLELRYSLRSSIEKRYPYEYMLRYISQDMCVDRPPIPLDAEYNIDEDYATSSTKAVSDTETTFYFFQSAVRTSTKNKMKTANDIAATFPSTRGIVMSGSLVTPETCQITTAQSSRVYFASSETPLPSLSLKFEDWRCCDHETHACRTFKGIRLVHRALEEEVAAINIYRRLKAELESSGAICDSGECGVPLYQA